MALAKNVVALTLLADGVPIIYQGQEQHEIGLVDKTTNRAPLWEAGYDTESVLYLHIRTLNAIRHHAVRTSYNYTTFHHYAIYNEAGTIALRKGNDGSQVVTVLTNDGENGKAHDLALTGHGFNASVTEIFSCEEYTVGDDGVISLPMEAGEPKVLYPTDLLYGSGLCDFPDDVPDDVPYPQQTTIESIFSTTVSGKAGTYSTAVVSPLPGPFQTQEATTTDDGGENGDEEPTQTSGFTSETGAAAGREMSSTLAMAVLLMVLCCL
jgi:alpha-amylase